MMRLVFVLAVVVAGCGAPTADLPGAPGDTGLSDQEANDLRFLREEEKLAHDVYVSLGRTWGSPVFWNIASSEQSHTDAVADRLAAWGVDDPSVGRREGEFLNPTLQALYTDLVALGSRDVVAAFTVGATIEDLDLADLDRLASHTTRSDLLGVFEVLARGSRNHLRSFCGQLTGQGSTYAPQYLSTDRFEAIVTTPTERGAR